MSDLMPGYAVLKGYVDSDSDSEEPPKEIVKLTPKGRKVWSRKTKSFINTILKKIEDKVELTPEELEYTKISDSMKRRIKKQKGIPISRAYIVKEEWEPIKNELLANKNELALSKAEILTSKNELALSKSEIARLKERLDSNPLQKIMEERVSTSAPNTPRVELETRSACRRR
jgi:hypothetical protein